MKVKLLLCAEGVIRDAQSGAISVFNILEAVNASGFPVAVNQLAILYVLEREETEPETATMRIKISNNDEQLLDHEIESEFSGRLRNRTIFNLNGLVLTNPGILKVVLVSGEDEVASYTIDVTSLETTTTTQPDDEEPLETE